jgi:hypothetical protein
MGIADELEALQMSTRLSITFATPELEAERLRLVMLASYHIGGKS